jgi:hypothetical protein
MSILSALKQQNSSIDDLAALPQAMIMQMAQKKQISEEMLAPILSRKAELAEAFARENALKGAGQMPPTVVEQLMAQNAQAEQPQMPQQMTPQMPPQMPPQAMPQMPEEAGVGQLPVPERQYAGGGIIAFSDGGMSDDEDEDYEDALEEADYDKMIERAMNAGEGNQHFETRHAKGSPQNFPNTGIASGHERSKKVTDEDQARKYNVGNLRPSGFTYPGQIGLSKGKFAMFDSPESGIAALQHDIGIKLNRGLDTPHKFISVYAPAGDKNDVDVYSKNVAKMLGIGSNEKIPNTPEAKQLLAQAIIRQEGAHKSTAAFNHGGEVQHFLQGGSPKDDLNAALSAVDIAMPEDYAYYTGNPMSQTEYYRQRNLAKNAIRNSIVLPKEPMSENQKRIYQSAYNNVPAFSNLPTKTDKPKASQPPKNEQPSTSAYIPNANPNLDNRDVGLQEGIVNGSPTQAQEIPKSRLDAYMDRMMAREDAMEKSRADDKNMALLTAGLGMLGGTSPYAMANIGQGALAGVQHLNESKKLRAAEQSAIDKSILYATRYQGAEDVARQNAEYNRGIKGAQLEETKRANTNKELEHAQANLNNYLKMQMDLYKNRFPVEGMPGSAEAMAEIYKRPEYVALAKRAGYTINEPSATFTPKQTSLLDKYLK